MTEKPSRHSHFFLLHLAFGSSQIFPFLHLPPTFPGSGATNGYEQADWFISNWILNSFFERKGTPSDEVRNHRRSNNMMRMSIIYNSKVSSIVRTHKRVKLPGTASVLKLSFIVPAINFFFFFFFFFID